MPGGNAGKSLTDFVIFDFCFALDVLLAALADGLVAVGILNRMALALGIADVGIARGAASLPPKAGKFSFVRARPLVPNGRVFSATGVRIVVGTFPSEGNSCSLCASITRCADINGVALDS